MPKTNEESLQIVFAGLMDLTALETHIVDGDLASGDEAIEIDAERAYVFRDVGGRLLKCDQSARLAKLLHSAHEEFDTEQCLTGASAACDERRTPLRQTPKGD